MSERFEEALVRHCAPTLAGHKWGSLVFCRAHLDKSCAQDVRTADTLLQEKACASFYLKNCREGCFIYLFRPSMLILNFLRTSEFFINKAIGWALRDDSQENLGWVRVPCGTSR